MRVPLSWLRDFVEAPDDAQEIALNLSDAGVPVEAVEKRDQGIRNVLVGQILTLEKHPHADRLSFGKVDLGDRQIQVITGAQNVYPGAKVPVAIEGAMLSGGITIRRSEIRGVTSEGMICSAADLALPVRDLPQEQKDGVLIFPEDTPVGANVVKLLSLDDTVLHLEVFANRPDLLSILGVAREVATVFGLPMIWPRPTFQENGEDCRNLVNLRVEDEDLCRRYIARVAQWVKIAPSPLWMQGRLQAAGIRCINNVVDVTNYVMLELGQPLHVFDYDRIRNRQIIVRRARQDEKILTIDGVERVLTPGVLVIADAEYPVAIAGVMGGLETEVSDSTRNVLLEAANFDPVSIRRTSQNLSLRSESSRRFEKGLPYHLSAFGSERAAELLSRLGCKIARGCVDAGGPAPARMGIDLRPERVRRVLGIGISAEQIRGILSNAGFSFHEEEGKLAVRVPDFRQDLREEIDLIEEITRVYGYDRVPYTLPSASALAGRDDPVARKEEHLRDLLARMGLVEVITYSLIGEDILKTLGLRLEDHLRIRNPLTEEQAFLRVAVFPRLLGVIKHNLQHRNRSIRIFELCKIYVPALSSLRERRALGIALCTLRDEEALSFFDLKGILENVLDECRILASFVPGQHPAFHPKRCSMIKIGERYLGLCGSLHPDLVEKLEIGQDVLLAEMDAGLLLSSSREAGYEALPKFPGVSIDLAIIVADEIMASEVEEVIRAAAGPHLVESFCFDLYRGEQIPAGCKSLAFTLYFRAKDRTLIDEEILEVRTTIVDALRERLGAKLRE